MKFFKEKIYPIRGHFIRSMGMAIFIVALFLINVGHASIWGYVGVVIGLVLMLEGIIMKNEGKKDE
ncbi:MAG: hypothetical protein KU37_02950 [Sulfuricurvum sp. PC08-66]|nr:MAG: hypothetical protein KU37_02950 [Sulfuricurvum sp. PC08-66]